MLKVLIDENLPVRLVRNFGPKLDVSTVRKAGWAGKKNGELLRAMTERSFDFFVTADQNLEYQHNLNEIQVTLVVIITHDVRMNALLPHVDESQNKILSHDNSSRLIHIDIRNRP